MNYYLCPITNRAVTVSKLYAINEVLSFNYSANEIPPFNVDEQVRVFLLQLKEDCLLPYEFVVAAINRTARTITVRVTERYTNSLPFRALSILLPGNSWNSIIQLSYDQVIGITSLMSIVPRTITQDEAHLSEVSIQGFSEFNQTLRMLNKHFEEISQAMQIQLNRQSEQQGREDVVEVPLVYGAYDAIDDNVLVADGDEEQVGVEIFSEAEVLDYIKDYIHKCGYYFDDETLYNYHICLKTRPFVILAGLSGTGKSQLARLYAQALGQERTFKRLPVRPNWNDDRYLLGHLNSVTGEYITEPAIEFILAALKQPGKLYSLCLDEMNLAHVEYYFSQFLSAMEGERPQDRRIELMSQRAYQQLLAQTDSRFKQHLPPAEIYLPDNLIFTGTINVDETTQPISDKVIDRANTIEFFNVDLDKIPEPSDPGDPLLISNQAWQSYRASTPDTRYRALIIDINKILKQADMGLGYRVVHEIELYLANSNGLLDPLVAFDLQCKQRILPRIRGTEIIDTMLADLIKFSKQHKLERTERRLQEMKQRLKRDGYTSFWR